MRFQLVGLAIATASVSAAPLEQPQDSPATPNTPSFVGSLVAMTYDNILCTGEPVIISDVTPQAPLILQTLHDTNSTVGECMPIDEGMSVQLKQFPDKITDISTVAPSGSFVEIFTKDSASLFQQGACIPIPQTDNIALKFDCNNKATGLKLYSDAKCINEITDKAILDKIDATVSSSTTCSTIKK